MNSFRQAQMVLYGAQNKSPKRDDIPNHPRVLVNGPLLATYFICGITNRLLRCQACNNGSANQFHLSTMQTKTWTGVTHRRRWKVYLRNLVLCGQNKLRYYQNSMTLLGMP